jgi:hypothetical protein
MWGLMRDAGKSDLILRIGLALLSFAAVVSMLVGVRHAIQYGSHDLQWMGARLVGQHIDPWQEALAHFPNHYPHFSPPNYLHALYLILLPLGLLSFHSAEILWIIASVCLSIVCVLMLQRLFKLTRTQAALAVCLLWMSSPFRVVLEVGQMSLFELFFLTGAYLAASTAIGGLSLGVSLVKYSFSPAAVMLFLFRGRIRFLLYAAAVPLVGLIGVWLLVKTPLLKLAMEPFAVSASPTSVSPGFADLMTLAEHSLKSHVSLVRARQFAYGLGLIGSVAYAFLLSRFRLSRSAEFTLISIASLFFVKHLIYDYVFLVVVLCFAMTQKSLKTKGVLIGTVLAFWFFLPLLDRTSMSNASVYLARLAVNCCLLALLLAFTTYLVTNSTRLSSTTAETEPSTGKLKVAP